MMEEGRFSVDLSGFKYPGISSSCHDVGASPSEGRVHSQFLFHVYDKVIQGCHDIDARQRQVHMDFRCISGEYID